MKNKRFGFFMILAFTALASACGTSGYYASSVYDDGIYYRPTADSRARMIAAQEMQREKERQRQQDRYLAQDEEGNLYVVTELLNGETYESRLRKFDSPYYVNFSWYGAWDSPWYNTWYNPWWGSWRYGFAPYYGYYNPYYSWNWGWYDPWYWGVGGFAGWYGHNYWYHWNDPWWHHPGPGPRPGVSNGRNVVYTPRNTATGGGTYRPAGNGTVNGSRGMYTTRRTTSGGSVSTRTTNGTVRNNGSSNNSNVNSNRPVRTGANNNGGYTRSSGSYSSGGGSATRSSGTSVSGGNHSGGGRR